MPKLRNIIWFSGIFLSLFWGIMFLSLSYFGYENFTFFLLNYYQKSEKLNFFREQMLTPLRFGLLQVFFLALMLLSALLSLKSEILGRRVLAFFSSAKESWMAFGKVFKERSLLQKYWLWGSMFLFASLQLFFLFQFPFFVDEVFSEVYFVYPGIGVALSYYPGPNNHILYNVICALFPIPFYWEPVWNMRLLSLCFSLLMYLLSFRFLISYFSFGLSMAALLLYFSMPGIFFYGFMGRGYALQALLWVLCTFFTFESFRSPKKINHFFYVLTAALGMYCIPVLVYALGGIQLFRLVWYQYFPFLQELKLMAWIAALTLLLYSPVLLFNGIEAILMNPWIQKPDPDFFYQHLLEYFYHLGDFFIPTGGGIFILLLVYIGMFFFLKSTKPHSARFASYVLCLWALPLGVIGMQGMMPPARSWIFLYFPLVIAITMLLDQVGNKRLSIVGLLMLALVFLSLSLKGLYSNLEKGKQYSEISKELAEHFENIFSEEDTYRVFLAYEFQKRGGGYKKMLGDNPHQDWDCIILSKKQQKKHTFEVRNFQLYFEDEEVIIYIKTKDRSVIQFK